MLTQSQAQVEQDVPIFYSASSICKWAGTENGLQYLDGDKDLPYIEKNGLWYYFGKYEVEGTRSHEYRLICSATKDLMEQKD